MRFGIGMNTDHTLEEVGLQFSDKRENKTNRGKSSKKIKTSQQVKTTKSFLENNLL